MQGRTAASGPLLRSAGLREFDALGSIGRPVIDSAPQLRATIRRQLGEDIAAMLAVPQINESGDAVDWYAPAGSLVVPWSAATPEEREEMRARMQAAREKVLAHGAALTEQLRARPAGTVADDFDIYTRLLPFVMRIPDDSHIYAVDGKPVLTFWGFANPRHPEVDVIRDLAPVAAQAVPAAAAAVPVAVSGRSWRWLWWLLLPLLALSLLLIFLRSCQPDLLPDALRPVLPDAAVPGVTTPTVPGVGVPGVGVPGVAVPGVAVPVVPGGAVSDGTDAGSAAVPPDAAASSQTEDRQADATPPTPQDDKSAGTPPQPDNPASPPPEDKKAEEKKSDPATPPQPDTQPKGTPLVIPPQAAAANDPAFLNGKWTSTSGLMDSRTGLPVTMEHEFKNGKGTTTIRRGDGTVCVGGSTAKMQGGKLVIVGDGDPKCSDGSHYGRPRVECRPGKDGRAVCSGKQAGGPDYSVDMRR